MEVNNQKSYLYEMNMMVRDYEVDSQGIVNNANYLHYMEHTRHQFCRMAGTSFRAMQAEGLDPVLRHVDIEYFQPLGLGQEMRSCLNLKRIGPRFVFEQDIYRLADGTLAASAKVTVVCLDHGRLSRGDKLAEAFARFL